MVFAVVHQPYFQYTSLKDSTDQIRLLTFDSRVKTAPYLHYTLQIYQLQHAPKYIALSYQCGSEEAKEQILVNGQTFLIRPNLHDFLDRLATSQPLVLWTDAVCINQEIDDERTQQVKLMGQIYRMADQVFAWLGGAADDSDMLIDFMNEKAATWELLQEHRNDIAAELYSRKLCNSIFRLCTRSYWGRVWIIQELVLARDIVFVCGSRKLGWRTLEAMICGWPVRTSGKGEWTYPRRRSIRAGNSEVQMPSLPDKMSPPWQFNEDTPGGCFSVEDVIERPYEVFVDYDSTLWMSFSRSSGSLGWQPELIAPFNVEYEERFGSLKRERGEPLRLDGSLGHCTFSEGLKLEFYDKNFDPKYAFVTMNVLVSTLLQTKAGMVLAARSDIASSTLFKLIRTYGAWNCSDARDRVYGMLAMAQDYLDNLSTQSTQPVKLQPDYSWTAARLLLETTNFCGPIDPISFGRQLSEFLDVGYGAQDGASLIEHVASGTNADAGCRKPGNWPSVSSKILRLSSNIMEFGPRKLSTTASFCSARAYALAGSNWPGPQRLLIAHLLIELDEPYVEAEEYPHYVIPDKLCLLNCEPCQLDQVFAFKNGEIFLIGRPKSTSLEYTCIGIGAHSEAYSSARWSTDLRLDLLDIFLWLRDNSMTISPDAVEKDMCVIAMPQPMFYLLLDLRTQDGQAMRFSHREELYDQANAWGSFDPEAPPSEHERRRDRQAALRRNLCYSDCAFEIFGESPWDKFWSGESADLGKEYKVVMAMGNGGGLGFSRENMQSY